MLSAVESNSHLGSSRAYNVHHHLAYGNGGGAVGPSPSITAGTGLNSYPTNGGPPMSAAEFVKPHPKLNRYNSLPSRNGGGLPPSPVSSANSKFKYAAGAAAASSATEQPVNLAMGSPSATSSPISSPQSAIPPGMEKLNFDFMLSRHAAAAAAAGYLPQNYPQLMYPPPPGAGPNGMSAYGSPQSPQTMKQQQQQQHHQQGGKGDHGSSSMSPPMPVGDRNGGLHLSEAFLNSHRYQQQQHQQFYQQMQQQQQQKALKGSSQGGGNGAGFMLPPASAIMPTQAEIEAYHERLFYQQPPPSAEQLLNAQRLHSAQQQQQQQSPNLPPPPQPVMPRSQPQQQQPPPPPSHQAGKRAIQEQGMYTQQQHQQYHRPQQNGGGVGGGGKGGVANQSPQDKNNNIGFKVPSGKEGSLKHRLLTTKGKGKGKQNGMKGNSGSGSSNSSNSSYGTSNIVKSNFNKGVLIELGNGELKPVEEMRTEDFILSSNVTPDLELIDSTILRIMPHGNVIVLTLSNSASKLNIDLTVAPEHPFFVYRQGWASCHPDGTYQMHGLKCQRLEVGDVCISLMQKERIDRQESMEETVNTPRINSGSSSSSSTSSASSSLSSPPPPPPPGQSHQQQHLQHLQQHQQQQDEPQNLSRKPSPMKESPRGLIEGTTHHPSLNSSSITSTAPAPHSIGKGSSSSSNGSARGDTSLYPSSVADFPQSLHAHHNMLTHEQQQHSSNMYGQAPSAQQQAQEARNPLMNTFLSTIKHNYLAAFEAAKAMANGGGGHHHHNGLTHSIKNIVNNYAAPHPPRQYSPPNGPTTSSLSPGSNGSKRRYSAPDNVFGDVPAEMGGRMGSSGRREGRLEHEEPPTKIASH